MERQQLIYLMEQYGNDTVTPAEREELQRYLQQEENMEFFTRWIADGMQQHNDPSFDAAPYADLSQKALGVDKTLAPSHRQAGSSVYHIHFLRRWGWAAAAVLALSAGAFLLATNHKKNTPQVATAAKIMNITPGHDGAVLTLSGGSQVVLDSLGNGLIAQQRGAKVLLQDGQLTYTPDDLPPTAHSSQPVAYNTMTTPKGRQFQLTLPDGTRVWLNSASSIRYPTSFTGKERKVEMKGEAYFEVAKNTSIPFKVNVNDQAEIEVLGTHFNVNAYENEQELNTTLLEGSVKIIQGIGSLELRPGQQARCTTGTSPIKLIPHADVDKVMAWKNGAFNFEDLSLEEAMRQLERWYDIRVVYADGIPNVRLGGEMDRNVNLSDLLKMLASTKLKFRIEGDRKLVIMK